MEWRGRLLTNPAKVAPKVRSLKILDKEIVGCDACKRLVDWREEVAITKRRAYQDQKYWGKPITGFGPGQFKQAQIKIKTKTV